MKDSVINDLLVLLSQGKTPSVHINDLSMEIFGRSKNIDDVMRELMAIRDRCKVDFITNEDGIITFWKTKPTLYLTAGVI